MRQNSKLSELVKIYCPNNIKIILDNNIKLYRGIKHYTDYVYYSKSVYTTCVTGFNLFASYVDNTWIDIPRRGYSAFCTNKISNAKLFGYPYLIIPFDNVKVFAKCPQDFNYLPVTINKNPLVEIAGAVKSVYELIDTNAAYKLANIYWTEGNIDILSSKIKEYMSNNPFSEECINLTKLIDGQDIKYWMDSKLTIPNMQTTMSSMHDMYIDEQTFEIWFEGDYLAIPCHQEVELMDLLK